MAEEAATATESEGAKPEEKPETSASSEPQTIETDWKSESRKHEKRAKESHARAQDLEARLSKIENENKSESEKALDKARKETRKEAEAEFDKERRADRLAVAVAGHARELADVDDVVLNLKQSEIADLFDDDGKVDQKALRKRLDDLLKDKPHLKAAGVGKPEGSADGGEGEGGGARSFNDMLRGR